MRIGVLGTGTVGRTLASGLVAAGHEVTMGSRTAGGQAASGWVAKAGELASEGTFAQAAGDSELIVNATAGEHSLAALHLAGPQELDEKVLIDVANPIVAGSGTPPRIDACERSLGERIQAEFPGARVVKTLNTVNAAVMTDPGSIPGEHCVFLSGDDGGAKETTAGLLGQLGWREGQIVDLGDISTAQGTEMYLGFWLRVMMAEGTPAFNVELRRA